MLGNVVSWLSCGAGGACVDTWCVMLLTICPVGRGTRACAVDLLSCGVEGARGTSHAAHGAIRAFDAIPQLALTRHLTSGPSAGIALASVSSLNCTGEGWRAVNRQVLQVCPPQLRLRQSTLLQHEIGQLTRPKSASSPPPGCRPQAGALTGSCRSWGSKAAASLLGSSQVVPGVMPPLKTPSSAVSQVGSSREATGKGTARRVGSQGTHAGRRYLNCGNWCGRPQGACCGPQGSAASA